MIKYIKENKIKIIGIIILILLIIGWFIFKKYTWKSILNNKKDIKISTWKSILNNKKNEVLNVNKKFVLMVNSFNEELTKTLPLKLQKKIIDWKILKEYFSCLSYNNITTKQLNKIWISIKTWEERDLIKKQYEKYCNNLLYTQYPIIFYQNSIILSSQDILPWSLLLDLKKYMITDKQKENYVVIKQFFNYNKLGIVWIIKWKNIWKKSYFYILKSLKWKQIDKDTLMQIKLFNKIILNYLK